MTTTDGDAPRFEWPDAVRLRRPQEFRKVYAEGERRTSSSFVVFVLRKDAAATRFGLTTSRRVGKAHERNRIRRRVREILRTARVDCGAADIVINPRRNVLTRDFSALKSELCRLLGVGE